MPRIPMANNPGQIQSRRGTVPMQGAPGMNFGMEEGRALANLGQSISRAGQQIGGAMQSVVSARNEFLVRQQRVEDNLAATEAENLYRQIDGELTSRMAENPNEYQSFREWAQEADRTYADQVQPILKRMSPQYKKTFEAAMQGRRIEAVNRRTAIGIQAKVTNDYNLFQEQWKDAAIRGDEAACRNMVAQFAETGLISLAEAEAKRLAYSRMAEFGAVRRLVESGDVHVAEQLKAQNDSGTYTHYTNLSAEDRTRLIRYADEVENRRIADNHLTFVTDVARTSECVTRAELDKQLDDGVISRREYQMRLPIVERFWAQQDAVSGTAGRAEPVSRKARLDMAKNLILSQPIPRVGDQPANRAVLAETLAQQFPGDALAQEELMRYYDKHLQEDVFGRYPGGENVKKHVEGLISKLGLDTDDVEGSTAVILALWDEAKVMLRNNTPAPEVMDRLTKLTQAYAQEKINSFFNPETGITIDPNKWGNVYDSREDMNPVLRQGVGALLWALPFSGAVTGPLWDHFTAPAKGDENSIDLADVVETIDEKDEKGNPTGRVVWELKNGKKVYADEYTANTDIR